MSGMNPLSFPQAADSVTENKSSFPFAPHAIQPAQTAPVLDGAARMKQLEQMLQEAQGRAEIVEKEAYDNAYLAGEKAGMTLGKKRAEQLLESVQETLQDAGSSLTGIQHAFADAAIDIAKHIAEQIVRSAIEHDYSKLLDIAQQATAQLPDTSQLKIAVSPDDFASFKRLLEESESLGVLSIDNTVNSGTCRIVSAQQDILIDPVAAVSSYLEQLSPAMLNEIEEPAKELSEEDGKAA